MWENVRDGPRWRSHSLLGCGVKTRPISAGTADNLRYTILLLIITAPAAGPGHSAECYSIKSAAAFGSTLDNLTACRLLGEVERVDAQKKKTARLMFPNFVSPPPHAWFERPGLDQWSTLLLKIYGHDKHYSSLLKRAISPWRNK